MNASFPPLRPRSKLPLVIVAVVALAALAGGALLLRPRFESTPPQIAVTPATERAGPAPIQVRIADAGTGVANLRVVLVQDGTEHAVASEQLAQPVPDRQVAFVPAKVAGIKEGPATLRVLARDAALFSGNEAVSETKLVLDLTPPTIEWIADDRYVNFGGVGALVYRVSADTVSSGVKFGSRFFPGFAGQVSGQPDAMLALFAHPYDTPAEARPVLVATDQAGNVREAPVAYELKNVRYRKSTIALSDGFLQAKVAPLLADPAARQRSAREVFVAVNKALRQQNEETIASITRKATPTRQWAGAFAQLSNSKVEANFADERTYTLDGQPIDVAHHLGYDLSVTKNYPAEAANAGTVVFAGDLGIYGNSVMLDHGLGLFSLYSHLSTIGVKEGEAVARRQPLGTTGQTGLAAGDHLHFGIYLAGVAVLPVEWWDPKWIDDNLTPKFEGRSGTEAPAAKPAKAAAKAKSKAARPAAAAKKADTRARKAGKADRAG